MSKTTHLSRRKVFATLAASSIPATATLSTSAHGASEHISELERIELLVPFAEATGLSVDLLEGVTRDLDRSTHTAVLNNFLNNVPANSIRLMRPESYD